MTCFKESYLFRLLTLLLAAYQDSGLHRLAVRAGAWCSRQIDESAILRPLCREGAAARSWPDSLACKLLSWLVNLPGRLLRCFYLLLEGTFEDSFFARLAFRLGDETAVAEGWLILLLWIIPYEYWNNAYTLMAFLALLLLLHAGAMGRGDRRLDVEAVGFFPALFFGAVVLGVVFSLTRNASTRFLIYHISAALCVLVTVSALRSAEELKRLAAGASGCVAVSSLYAIFQRLSGLEVNESYVDMDLNADMPSRVLSFFDNPNTFAEVLILLLPLTLALILCSKHFISKLAASAAFVLGAAALGMTYCRAAWIGIACAMVVMLFLWKPKLLPLFFALCVLAAPFLPLPPVQGRAGGHPPPSPLRGGPGHRRRSAVREAAELLPRPDPLRPLPQHLPPGLGRNGRPGLRGLCGLRPLGGEAGGPRRPALRRRGRPDHHLRRLRRPLRGPGLRSGGLPLELSPGHVHLLVRLRRGPGRSEALRRNRLNENRPLRNPSNDAIMISPPCLCPSNGKEVKRHGRDLELLACRRSKCAQLLHLQVA